jgi:glycosyltransferase involved in cell wall biosynthesis
VVCSDRSSLPEVVGTAGRLVPPRDVGAWVEALRSVILAPDKALTMRLASLRRAELFTVEREVRATVDVYARAYERATTRQDAAPRMTVNR